MSDSESSEDRASTPATDPVETDEEGALNASRRDVLKGGGLFASSMFAAGEVSVPDDLFGQAEGTVPDEPEEGGQVRQFSVHAIEADIVYNRYGLHQPVATPLVLEEDLREAREASGKVPCDNNLVDLDAPFCEEIPDDERADEVDTRVLQPLTLKANKGDIVEIEFHNHLDRPASIHQTSLPYDVEESDGMDVGFNPDTTVDPGESITYRWFAEQFGTHFFLDGANQAVDSADEPPQVANLNSRGLFGALSVYPKGTEWSDPYTGKRDHVTRDEIAHAKYGEHFSDLSVETTGQVQAIFNRQSVSDWSSIEGVRTREEIAERRYGVTVDEADLADALSREQIIEVQNEYDEQFGDLPDDPEYSRDDIAQAKYGERFSDLSAETTGQVQAIFNRQPFPGETTPDEVLTREEIAEDRFGKHYFALGSRDRRIDVENAYDAQFRPGNRSKRIRVQGRVQSDIHIPENIPEEAVNAGHVGGVSYRDFKAYYHTPEGIQTRDGDELTFPDSDEPQSVHAINNRADPTGIRIDGDRCAACGEGTEFYNSWIHGDPGGGDNVYPMYTGDPVRVTAIGASIEENHVHHLHGHRWKETPPNDGSDTIDSQTVGMGAVYEAPLVPAAGTPRAGIDDFQTVRPDMEFEEAFQVGAGGSHKAAGDHLFHCHLFPHYGEGMWGIMRILDKESPGLQELPNNDPPLSADSEIPGYPDFIPGEFEQGPPFPPYGAAGLDDYRDPTPEEEQALTRNGDILPGAPYTDPADPQLEDFESEYEGETREYTIVALPANVVYNDDGHHDPEGKVYVLEEDAEKVRSGEMNPEPLVIRANVGDTVEITLKNEIEEDVVSVPTAADSPDLGGGKSNHIHFVSYDVLGSDSLATGFNYNQQSLPDRPIPSRWYADEEGTIFFHDHITGIENVMNGTFCALIVEPPESEWLDPHTGEPIRSGTQAIIQNPNGDDFREFGLAYQDFAQLRDRDGDFVNPDREHDTNAGVMAINYRNAPYYTREDADPAYVHSSYVHGDPPTPTLEAYENDPVRFRIWQGAYEEQHNFGIHGRDFESEGLDPEEAITEVIGTSEAFNLDLLPEADEERIEGLTENPSGLPVRDYAYGSSTLDDLWDGMWGIHRVFGGEVDHLHPLPDRGAPGGKISEAELREMGHPAPFSDYDWSEVGHEAKLLYGEDDNHAFPPDKDARQNKSIDGNPPPKAPSPGDPCPDDAPVRSFDVCAFQSTIRYNDHGDQDPLGTIFALDQHVEDIVNGDRRTHPLTLWANQGDCIEVNLTNKLGEVFYQVDLVVGEPDERLGETPEDFYGEEGRLVRFAHGSTTDPLTRRGSGGPDTLAEKYAECIDSEHIAIEDGTASVTFTVRDGCELELSLAGYRKPEAGFDRDLEQELFDAATETFGPGTHTLTLDVPDQREPRADNDHAHPQTRTKEENLGIEWERSERISLHPTRIDENVLGSDGATTGFNWDQTVAPGETITYRWFAEEAIGSVLLWDHADIRSNRHHGAYGQILVEDPDVEFADDGTAEPIVQGLESSGMLKASDGLDLREFALLFVDAQYIVNPRTDVCVVPPGPEAEEEGGDPDAPCNQIPDDPEDQGYPAVSYRSEPFIRRFDDDPDLSQVYDSETHGDPATPLPQALLGDPVLFRVNKAADKARGLSFHLSEHQWNRLTEVEESADIGVDDRFSVGSSSRVDPFGGAGGVANADGDFIYQELKQRRRLEGGMWGIFRVRESLDGFQSGAQASTHDSNGDNPVEGSEHLIQPLPEMAAEQELMPEDRPGWSVARGDLTGDGTNDLLVGVPSSDIGGTEAGTAYVLFGRGDDPVTDLLDADMAFVGPEAGAQLGSDVAINGTSTGDGKQERSTTDDGERERSTTGGGEQSRTGDGQEEMFYQVDLVVGAPEERLGETPEDFYGNRGRLIRFAHGNTADPLTRRGSGGPNTLAGKYAECIDSEHIAIEDGTASVTFTVRDGCELELSLAGYRKPGAGFDRDVEQELFGAATETFGPGTHTLTLDVPAEPSVTIGSEDRTFTISMEEGFGAIADAGDGDVVDVSAVVSADADGEPAGAIAIEGEMPDAAPGDGEFTGSRIENATVTEIPPGEAPPDETPAEAPPDETPAETPADETPREAPADETPAETPPVTIAMDGGLADTITGNIGIVVDLGMIGSR